MVARLWIPPAQPMTVAPSTRSSRPYPYKLNDTRRRKKAQRNDCARSNVLDGKVIAVACNGTDMRSSSASSTPSAPSGVGPYVPMRFA